MSALVWNPVGARFFEAGVEKGVLYPSENFGVSWNGLVSVVEQASGGEHSALYHEGIKYLDEIASEDYQAQLSAFTYPAEFDPFDGRLELAPGVFATRQRRAMFGLSYRSNIGNDVVGVDFGYKIHILWNAIASPALRTATTYTATLSPALLQWTIHAKPPASDGYKPTAHFTLDSTRIEAEALAELEAILYGTDLTDPRIPTQAEVIGLAGTDAIMEPISEPI